ncbi:hypothetical protein CR513_07503, partial [Mucuna pruriens]
MQSPYEVLRTLNKFKLSSPSFLWFFMFLMVVSLSHKQTSTQINPLYLCWILPFPICFQCLDHLTNKIYKSHRVTGTLVFSFFSRSLNNIYKPKQFDVESKHPLPTNLKPFSVRKTMKHAHRRRALMEELDVLLCNDTWLLVSFSKNKNIVGYK